jgi:hypothetical protein
MPSENERRNGNEGRGCVVTSSPLIYRSHTTSRAKLSSITSLYMYAQVCVVPLSTLVSLLNHTQDGVEMAVSPFIERSSSHMGLLPEATVGEVATSTFSLTNILPPSRLSHREYGAMPADKERERGNTDAQAQQSS